MKTLQDYIDKLNALNFKEMYNQDFFWTWDKTDDELAEVRQLARDAQFYWDFVFVENSEGVHNPALARDCLNRAESLGSQAALALVALTT